MENIHYYFWSLLTFGAKLDSRIWNYKNLNLGATCMLNVIDDLSFDEVSVKDIYLDWLVL